MREALRESCPPLEKLTALFDGQLGAAEARQVEAHMTACAVCQAEWKMLKEFVEAEATAEEAADVAAIAAGIAKGRKPEKKAGLGLGWWGKLAGALAMAALVVVVGVRSWGPGAPQVGGEVSGTMRTAVVANVRPEGDVQAVPVELAWEAVAGAVRYEVVVTEVDGTEVWRGTTSGNSLAVGEAVKGAMQPAKTLVWKVSAWGEKGMIAERAGVRMRWTKD